MRGQLWLLLSCEHAGKRIPPSYEAHFRKATAALNSHRGWDPGALELAHAFRRQLDAPLFYTPFTRLLVEPNRSLHHRQLFSEFTHDLSAAERQQILERYYHPHRTRVENWIDGQMQQARTVLHVSVHTFTPRWNETVRRADVGLLYDPARRLEQQFCIAWQKNLRQVSRSLRVRRNYPYLGKADGLTTFLRRRFPGRRYGGIELEVNQGWLDRPDAWREIKTQLVVSLAETISAAG